jgi:PAS domain S-box-containing protein
MQVGRDLRVASDLAPVLEPLRGAGPLHIVLLDLQLRCTAVNEAAAGLHRIPVDGHVGSSFSEVSPHLAAVLDPLLRRVIETGVPVVDIDVTSTIPRPHPRPYRAFACLYPLYDAGEVAGVGAFWWDVTDRADHQALMGEAERRFREMADAAPVMIWMSTLDGRCTWVNRRWTEWTGRTTPQELGTGWLDGVHPDERARLDRARVRERPPAEPVEAVYRLRRADGSYGWVLQRAAPRMSGDGKAAGLIGTCTDISELQELQGRVVDTKERLERLQRLTVALSGAATTARVVDAMLEHALPAVGADGGAAALLDGAGGVLEVVGVRGDPACTLAEVRRSVPLDANVPLAAALRAGGLVRFESRDRLVESLPGIADHVDVPHDIAVAAVPLATSTEVFGAFTVSFGQARTFTGEDLDLLDTVVTQCLQAYERALLYEREAEARATAERAGQRIAFLATASELLAASLDLCTLTSLARLSVSEVADSCLIYLPTETGAPELVAAAHRDPSRSADLSAAVQAHPPTLDGPGVGCALRTGAGRLFADLGSTVGDGGKAFTGGEGHGCRDGHLHLLGRLGRTPCSSSRCSMRSACRA